MNTLQQRRIEFDGYRFYNCANNIYTDTPIILASSTTILGETKDPDSKLRLKQWQKNNPDKSKIYINDGNIMHLVYEYQNSKRFNLKFNNSEPLPKVSEMTARQIRLIKNFKPLNDRIQSLKSQEEFTFFVDPNTGRGWAGTKDARGSILIETYNDFYENIPLLIDDAIIDFKSSENPKKSRYIHDYKLQGLSYVLAENQRTSSSIQDVVILVSVNSNEIRNQYFHVSKNELNELIHEFIDRVNNFYITNDSVFKKAELLALEMQTKHNKGSEYE